jgi:hypothetical protein
MSVGAEIPLNSGFQVYPAGSGMCMGTVVGAWVAGAVGAGSVRIVSGFELLSVADGSGFARLAVGGTWLAGRVGIGAEVARVHEANTEMRMRYAIKIGVRTNIIALLFRSGWLPRHQ